MTYVYLGSNGSSIDYQVTFYVYRDCSKDGTKDEVPFDKDIVTCAYFGNGALYDSYSVPLISQSHVPAFRDTNACSQEDHICQELGIYRANIVLPEDTSGFYLHWERCCRVTLNNLMDSSSTLGYPYQGATYSCFIPYDKTHKSHSPFINYTPVLFMCIGDTSSFKTYATDADNDSLTYKFVTPLQGGSLASPIQGSCTSTKVNPPKADYLKGYSVEMPFDSAGYANLDSTTGNMTLMSPQTGCFAVATEVAEWRNGAIINTTHIEYAIIVIDPLLYLKDADIKDVKVYPNPASENINIAVADSKNYSWKLIDFKGRLCAQGGGKGSNTISTSHIFAGLYSVVIQIDGVQTVRKVSVLH